MNCSLHQEIEAVAVCVDCKNPLCEDCVVKIDGRNYCNDCAQSQVTDKRDIDTEMKNLSQMPGDVAKVAGKMQGFLKKKSSNLKDKTGKGIDGYKNKTEQGLDKGLINIKETGTDILDKFSKSLKEGSTRDLIKSSKIDSKNPLDEIKKAKELLEIGAITEEEFNEIKKKYLESM